MKKVDKPTTAKQRDSNFELLRIITMLWITFYHLNCHGFEVYSNDFSLDFNNIIIKGTTALQGISNLIFLMISGYFLVNSTFKWEKVLKLWFQCFFYSFIIGTVLYFGKFECIAETLTLENTVFQKMQLKDYLKSFIPILNGGNWFTSSYIVFYIFSPFIVKMLKTLTQKQHLFLLVTTVFLGSFLNMIYSPYYFSRLYYFIEVLFIASYIKLYPHDIFNNKKLWILLLIATFFLYFLLLNIVNFKFHGRGSARLIGMEHIPMLSMSFIIFCIFRNIHINYNPIINKISSCTLSVYLIHDNQYKYFLWNKIFNIPSFRHSKYYILYAIAVCLAIFSVSICIELFRKRFIEKPLFSLMEKCIYKNTSEMNVE